MESGKCIARGRALKSPESLASGIGPTCARKGLEKRMRLEALLGPTGARLMFPEIDQPAIDAALDEAIK